MWTMMTEINSNWSDDAKTLPVITSVSAVTLFYLCSLSVAVYRQKHGDGRVGHRPR